MRIDGNCLAGGPIDRKHGLPIPVDPTLHRVRPEPPRPVVDMAPKALNPRPSTRKQGTPVPEDVREAVIRDRESGDSAAAISLRYGIHRVTVYKICQGAA